MILNKAKLWYIEKHSSIPIQRTIKQFDTCGDNIVLFRVSDQSWLTYNYVTESSSIMKFSTNVTDFIETLENFKKVENYTFTLDGIITGSIPLDDTAMAFEYIANFGNNTIQLNKQLCLMNNIKNINNRITVEQLKVKIRKLRSCQSKKCIFH